MSYVYLVAYFVRNVPTHYRASRQGPPVGFPPGLVLLLLLLLVFLPV